MAAFVLGGITCVSVLAGFGMVLGVGTMTPGAHTAVLIGALASLCGVTLGFVVVVLTLFYRRFRAMKIALAGLIMSLTPWFFAVAFT